MFTPEEWKGTLPKVLAQLKNMPSQSSAYLQIRVEEKLYSQLLNDCKKYVDQIEKYDPYLLEDYFNEVEKLFGQYMEKRSEVSTNRSQYRQACYIIRKYQKLFGRELDQNLIESLKEKYRRRPAVSVELSKI